MWSYHEEQRHGHVSTQQYCSSITPARLFIVFISPVHPHRTIQDPASQRLTWYRNPLSVLVIKKVRDMSVLPPFIQLVRWLIQVRTLCTQTRTHLFYCFVLHLGLVHCVLVGKKHDSVCGTFRDGRHNAYQQLRLHGSQGEIKVISRWQRRSDRQN